MVQEELVIKNKTGLHARPASSLVKLSKQFASNITIGCGERKCDAKHLFKLLHCGFKMGERIVLEVDGADETEALQQLVTFINNLQE